MTNFWLCVSVMVSREFPIQASQSWLWQTTGKCPSFVIPAILWRCIKIRTHGDLFRPDAVSIPVYVYLIIKKCRYTFLKGMNDFSCTTAYTSNLINNNLFFFIQNSSQICCRSCQFKKVGWLPTGKKKLYTIL